LQQFCCVSFLTAQATHFSTARAVYNKTSYTERGKLKVLNYFAELKLQPSYGQRLLRNVRRFIM